MKRQVLCKDRKVCVLCCSSSRCCSARSRMGADSLGGNDRCHSRGGDCVLLALYG